MVPYPSTAYHYLQHCFKHLITEGNNLTIKLPLAKIMGYCSPQVHSKNNTDNIKNLHDSELISEKENPSIHNKPVLNKPRSRTRRFNKNYSELISKYLFANGTI